MTLGHCSYPVANSSLVLKTSKAVLDSVMFSETDLITRGCEVATFPRANAKFHPFFLNGFAIPIGNVAAICRQVCGCRRRIYISVSAC